VNDIVAARAGLRYRHKKSGGVYEIMAFARVEATLEWVVVYRSVVDDETWTRPVAEFLDGRFELVASKRQLTSAPLCAASRPDGGQAGSASDTGTGDLTWARE
jgi:Protein of unknown function (DUF1653)